MEGRPRVLCKEVPEVGTAGRLAGLDRQVSVSQTEQRQAAGGAMVGPDQLHELSGSIDGGPAVINIVTVWPNHGLLHKFERPVEDPGLPPACAQSRPPM
ncbi:hypothetical protein DHEL01_v200926 [Diaporthe helianthi]|uniref:Uncharacterized protein n=1 Tax=Diaporthe helianthi TaxID=158607 RepID=A0A2P5IDW6_DIAHE|nr:hypothetical protein DHEL01_v200926 [Diaporthe helianthi]